VACRGCLLSWSLLGVKRTWPIALHMSAFDPKRTCHPTPGCEGRQRPLLLPPWHRECGERVTMRALGALGYALGIVTFVIVSSSVARATTTYTYVGNNYSGIIDSPDQPGTYTSSMFISGFFTVASPLPANLAGDITADVVHFSFFDGRNTITDSDITFMKSFSLATDGSGAISAWFIQLGKDTGGNNAGAVSATIITRGGPGFSSGYEDFGQRLFCVLFLGVCNFVEDSGVNFADPGSWSRNDEVATAPLPATLPLFATGLGALGLFGWRRKKGTVAFAA
jgi:hypothetical protein